jgi:hypothetical protein
MEPSTDEFHCRCSACAKQEDRTDHLWLYWTNGVDMRVEGGDVGEIPTQRSDFLVLLSLSEISHIQYIILRWLE